MSKNIVYECDSCHKEVFNIKPKWLEIGSESECGLYITNEINKYGIKSLNNHNSIHLCSKICLIAFFLGKDDAVIFHNALELDSSEKQLADNSEEGEK